jgi:hypothetical protein
LRFLDVGEIGFQGPGELERKRRFGPVADDDGRGELIEADAVGQREIDATLRNAFAVTRFDIASLPAAAPLIDRDFRVGIDELEMIRSESGRFAQPRPVTVNSQVQRAEETRFT